MINNDDEFAFPIKEPNTSHIFGMTLRDYFAAKALQGLLACSETSGDGKSFADTAYKIADAMLVRRKS